MFIRYIVTVLLIVVSANVFSQDNYSSGNIIQAKLTYLQNNWAIAKYQLENKSEKVTALKELLLQAKSIEKTYPNYAEFKIWHGIILATIADTEKNLSSLKKVRKAKKLFETAISIDPSALGGSALTSLGSLYYQVPSWPISFGDKNKAKMYLKQALKINSFGIDANYFYADYLARLGHYNEAVQYFKKALRAEDRPNRIIADKGRRAEINLSLTELYKKIN